VVVDTDRIAEVERGRRRYLPYSTRKNKLINPKTRQTIINAFMEFNFYSLRIKKEEKKG